MTLRAKGLAEKLHLTKWGIVCLALVVALAATGITYARWSKPFQNKGNVHAGSFQDPFTWVVSNDDAAIDDVPPYGLIDPGDNGLDPKGPPPAVGEECPRYDKDVASTTAVLTDPDNITVILTDAYPCYYPTIFYGLENMESTPGVIQSIEVDENAATPEVIDDIDELFVTVTGIYEGQVLNPGEEVIGDLEIHVDQSAAQDSIYTIRIKIIITAWLEDEGGTPGFWKNWNKHQTFTETEIEGWLVTIAAGSQWLGPTTVEGMETLFADGTGKGATAEERFLAHYLATSLNGEAGTLSLGVSHDVSSYDPGDYLGLVDPTSATLPEIIAAIESKYGTSPAKNQFDIMKTICRALNEVQI